MPYRLLLLLTLVASGVAAQAPPSDLAALELEAEAAFAEDDLPLAISRYGALAERVPAPAEKVRVLITVAWLHHQVGNDVAARDTLTRALVLVPDHPFRAELYDEGFRGLFFDAKTRAAEERRRRATDFVRTGRDALQRRDYAAARDALGRGLELDPDHPYGLYNLGLVELFEGKSDAAIAVFEKVLAKAAAGPDAVPRDLHAGALTNLGLLQGGRGLHAEAAELHAKAVALDPGNGTAWSNLGVERRVLGDRAGAAEAFRKAYELTPEDPNVVNNLALADLDVGDFVAAAELLRAATARSPERPGLWLNLGVALLGLGDADAAASAFEEAIRRDPDDGERQAATAAVHLARQAYGRSDYEAARRYAERARDLRPAEADGWIYLGLAQKALGELGPARESFERALTIDPARADSHNNLGSVFFDLGLLDRAESSFERALALDPALPGAADNLAAVRRIRAGAASLPGATPPRTPPPTTSPPTAAAPPTRPPPPPPPSTAAPRRLGLRFADIDYAALGLRGVMVSTVDPGSIADRAGIIPNDLILRVDGRDVRSAADVERFASEARGGRVAIDLLRSNRPVQLELRLNS